MTKELLELLGSKTIPLKDKLDLVMDFCKRNVPKEYEEEVYRLEDIHKPYPWEMKYIFAIMMASNIALLNLEAE